MDTSTKDTINFIEKYMTIDGEPIRLTKTQKQFIKFLSENDNCIVLCGRQFRWTYLRNSLLRRKRYL